MADPITEIAPAKVNLFLHIVGRRADGYHLIESQFGFTAQGDTLTFAPADEISLAIDGPFADNLMAEADWQHSNLVTAAARALQTYLGLETGAHITLTKVLPVAAGIGGGSADCAAALRGLCRLWGVAIELKALQSLALSLGADIPACLAGEPVMVRGIGERLDPVPMSQRVPAVLVNPLRACATAAVFASYRASGKAFREAQTPPATITALLQNTGNDLTAAAVEHCPDIATILETLGEQPGCMLARMSGSGATCFALFETDAAASAASQHCRTCWPGYWVMQDWLRV